MTGWHIKDDGWMTEDHCCVESRPRQVWRDEQSHEERQNKVPSVDVTVDPPSIIEQLRDE